MSLRSACLVLCLGTAWATPPDSGSFTLLRARGLEPQGDVLLAWLAAAVPADMEAVNAWIPQLGAARESEREAAQRALRRYAWLLLPQLEAARNSRDPEVRLRLAALLDPGLRARETRLLDAVLRALAWLQPDGACTAVLELLPLLRGKGLRRSVRDCLWNVTREEDLAAVVAASRLDDPELAALGATALGGCGLLALPRVRELLASEPEVMRLGAALALARLAPREALPRLVDLLEASTAARRRQALFALEQLTGQSLDFQASASPESRQAALQRWRDWLPLHADDDAVQALRFLEPGRAVGRYLLSSPNQGLLCLDRQGHELFRLACDPYDAELQADGSLIVAERSLGRVQVLTADGGVLRQLDGLSGPCDVAMVDNGHLLVLENAAGRVVELDATGAVVWQLEGLSNPYDADRLPNGNTLVADSGNGRLLEVDSEGSVVWEVGGLAFPNNVLRLDDGTTLLTTYTSGGVIRLDADGAQLWQTDLETTLYSLGVEGDTIFVADGTAGRVFQLDADGQNLEAPQVLPRGFVDLHFAP